MHQGTGDRSSGFWGLLRPRWCQRGKILKIDFQVIQHTSECGMALRTILGKLHASSRFCWRLTFLKNMPSKYLTMALKTILEKLHTSSTLGSTTYGVWGCIASNFSSIVGDIGKSKRIMDISMIYFEKWSFLTINTKNIFSQWVLSNSGAYIHLVRGQMCSGGIYRANC